MTNARFPLTDDDMSGSASEGRGFSMKEQLSQGLERFGQAPRTCRRTGILCTGLILLAGAAAACEQDMSLSGSAEIAAAAEELLQALSAEERAKATFALDAAERAAWTNLPARFLVRPGIRLGDLNNAKRNAVSEFLGTALSRCGVLAVEGILGAEAVLSTKRQAERFGWTDDNFWLAVYGTPSETEPWAWGFGGHHLALNATLAAGRMALSPSFVGIEPARYRNEQGKHVAPLDAAPNRIAELLAALDAARLEESRLSDRPNDILAGADKDGLIPELPPGRVGAWRGSEQDLLLAVIGEWVNLMPPGLAAPRMAEVRADAESLRFGWHETSATAGDLYVRIQSAADSLLIEFSMNGGRETSDESGHYHSIYRNPSDEYGSATIASAGK